MKRRLFTLTLLVALATPVAASGGTAAYGVAIRSATVNPDRSVTIDWALESANVSSASVTVDGRIVMTWSGPSRITTFRTAPLPGGSHTITVDALEWFETYTRSGSACTNSGDHWACSRSWRRSVAVAVPSPNPTVCVVPNVVGLSIEGARARITRAGCRLGAVTRIPARQTAGTVLVQQPKPNRRFRIRSPISLVVSDG